MTIYDKIGVNYNSTRKADPVIFEKLFDLLSPSEGMRYLDIGCGTGNYTTIFAERGVNITGVDPSELMLDEARGKRTSVQWINAAAEQMPLKDGIFDGALATFTIHHWNDMDKGLTEVARVLRNDARLVLLTFTPAQERGYWLNHYFPNMMLNSIKRKNTYERMLQSAAACGFSLQRTEKYFVHDGLQDIFCYAGKNNPELYFNQSVRSGISSFALWPNETNEGLKRLREDMESGAFDVIRKQYDNDLGDYIFVVLKLSKHETI